MSEEAQERLVTILAAVLGATVSGPLASRFVEAPEDRGIGEDIKEGVIKAVGTMISTVIASVLVRQLLKNLR